jgi:hypothetical protein
MTVGKTWRAAGWLRAFSIGGGSERRYSYLLCTTMLCEVAFLDGNATRTVPLLFTPRLKML